MRHRKNTDKLGRTSAHRGATIANVLASLITHERITTTLRIARSIQRYADRLITLGKTGTLHARRQAVAALRTNAPDAKAAVRKLFTDLAPRFAERKGGYTRIVKLVRRRGDSAPMALIEYVDATIVPKRRAKKAETADIAVETEVAGDVQTQGPEQKRREEPTAPPAAPKEKQAAPPAAPAKPAEKKPAAQEPSKPEPRDRKGGLGRFFKNIFKLDNKNEPPRTHGNDNVRNH